jgi:YbgC/YbaW family acyl-CoA thioester hydrolase
MGVVYHTNYIKWFEVGRCELLRSIGYPYSVLEESRDHAAGDRVRMQIQDTGPL